MAKIKTYDGIQWVELLTELDSRNRSIFTVSDLDYVSGNATSGSYLSVRWYNSGVEGITTPYDGMKIMVKVPVAGVGTAGAMLSINGNNDADFHPLAYNASTALTSHYAAGTYKMFVYDASATMACYKTSNTKVTVTGVWKAESNYVDGNTTTTYGTIAYYLRPYCAQAVYRYKFCALDKDNRLVPIETSNILDTYSSSTSYTVGQCVWYNSVFYKCIVAGKNKTPSSTSSYWSASSMVPTATPFRPDKIYWYNTTTTCAAGSAITSNSLVSIGYSASSMVLDNFAASIPAYRMVYLKGTYNKATGLFTLAQSGGYYVAVPSNTDNITLSSYFTSGYDYILIGGTHSSANYLHLREQNTMYHFDGTNLLPYDTYNDNRIEGLIPTNTNQLTNGAGFITGITSSMVTTALGFTPYNSSNPNGYTSNTGTVIGSGLTADQIVVGNGTVNVKITSYKPSGSGTTWNSDSDVFIPTMKAIKNYVTGLGYTSNAGTVTGIKVGSNGTTLTPSSGVITIPAYPSTSGLVPYEGANGNVDLGNNTLLAASIEAVGSNRTATLTASEITLGLQDTTGHLQFPSSMSGQTKTIATQEWVEAKGYTTNTGTVTKVKVGSSGTEYSPSNGVVTIPAYPTVPSGNSLWNSGSTTWNNQNNVTCQEGSSTSEWSFDCAGTYEGNMWHVWSSKNSKTILACYPYDNKVAIPNGNLLVSGTISEGGTLLSNKYAAVSHSHSFSNMTGGFIYSAVLDVHPESTTTTIAYYTNDLVNLIAKGGSLTATNKTTGAVITSSTVNSYIRDNWLDGTPSYGSFSVSAVTDVVEIVIELPSGVSYSWGTHFGIGFGNSTWRAKDVKIEAGRYADGTTTWKTVYNVTNSGNPIHDVGGQSGPDGVSGNPWNRIRITLTNFNGTSPRIAQIWTQNYGSQGLALNFLQTKGGTMYGTINSQTILPRVNASYDLGSSSYKFNNIHAVNIYENGTSISSKYIPKTQTVADGGDLNSATEPGFYRVNQNISNGFPSYTHGQMIVVRGGGDTIAQIGFPYSSSKMYIRCGNPVGNANGVWKDWKAVVNSDELSNATITIKQSGRSDQTFTLNGSATTINLDNTTYSAATTSANGLMSSTDKTRLDSIWNVWSADGTDDTLVNKVQEVLTAFTNFNEGDTITGLLANKLPLSGGTLTSNTTPILMLKRSASSAGAFIGFKSNNQDAKIWYAGQDSANAFRISYSSDSGATSTEKFKVDTSGNVSASGSISEGGTALSSKYLGINAAAASAAKINTDAGSGTQPVYFSGGIPVACTYSLAKSVPSDAKFTDHEYTAGTGLTLSSGQFSVSSANASTILNQLTTGSSTPVDADYYISQYVGGGNSTTSYHRRPMSCLWAYVKSKADSTYQAKGTYLTSHQSLDGVVPYTGATGDVNLNGHSLTTTGNVIGGTVGTQASNQWSYLGVSSISFGAQDYQASVLNFPSIGAGTSNTLATQEWVNAKGYTTNAGTVTSVNNVSPSSGNVSLTLDNVSDGSTRKLANYMPLGGSTFTGPISFNATSLPQKSLSYVVGIDAFADGGQMGWQSKSNFLSGYVTGTGLTADKIVLGNANSAIKISTYEPASSSTTWDSTSDVYLPTMKAIKTYVEGKGYTSNAGTVTSVQVQAGTGLSSSTSTAQSTSLSTTISIASGYKLPTTTEWSNKADASDLNYLTTAPTSANTSGKIKIVILSSEPTTKYSGYIYIIT